MKLPIAWTLVMLAGCAAPVAASRPFEIVARPANAVAIVAHGTDRVVIDARVGIGRADIRAPDGFPDEVTLRFPGFRQLERVRAVSGTRSIACDLHRLENRETLHSCRAVGTPFEGALAREERGFELALPPGFAVDSLSLEWVDQFR